jgi:hypothetical protein
MSPPTQIEQARFSLGVPAPSFPRAWMAMQMKHGKHGNKVVFNGKEDAVRKITNQSAPGALVNLRKLERILEDSRKDGIDLRFEAEAEVSTLSLVSKRRFENLELGLGRNIELPHLACSAEAGQKLFANLRPRAGGHFAAPVRSEALGHNLAMPLGHRYLLRMLGEMIPKRLNVFELLVRRELVETRRRKRRLRHIRSIPPSGAAACLANATTANWRQERSNATRDAESTGPRQEWRSQFHIS